MDYGSEWRAHRRMFHQYYNKTQIHKYAPIMEKQMLAFLQQLEAEPQHFLEHTR
jgi:cytochrome P450